MKTIKKNIALIIGLSIPVLMILSVAGSVYLPGLFTKPQFNFLYVTGEDSFYNDYNYTVENGKLVKNKIDKREDLGYPLPSIEQKLYLYDVAKNEGKEISFNDARTLSLDTSPKSPDGFEVVHGSNSGGLLSLFWGGATNYNTSYLKGNNVSKKLNLQTNDGSYYGDFRLMGWVK